MSKISSRKTTRNEERKWQENLSKKAKNEVRFNYLLNCNYYLLSTKVCQPIKF